MKRAFTMVELIFVIILLGILAAVAIPILATTRDDAHISKAAINVSVAVSDIASYYTSRGVFGSIDKMSNVPIDSSGKMKVKGIECFQFAVGNATASDVDSNKGIIIGTPILKAIAISSSDNVCKGAQEVVKKIIESSPINVGSSSIKFN